jgi:hypothetical protein
MSLKTASYCKNQANGEVGCSCNSISHRNFVFNCQAVGEERNARNIIFLTTSAKLIVVGRHENKLSVIGFFVSGEGRRVVRVLVILPELE